MGYLTKTILFDSTVTPADYTFSELTSAGTPDIDLGGAPGDGALLSVATLADMTHDGEYYVQTPSITNDGLNRLTAVWTPHDDGGGVVKFALIVDNVHMYWNSALGEWREGSDHTCVNTIAEINDKLSALGTDKMDVAIRAYFTSNGVAPPSAESPSLDLITVQYDFAPVFSDPPLCQVYGRVLTIAGEPVSGITVGLEAAVPGDSVAHDGTATAYAVIQGITATATTNTDGIWEATMVSQIDGADVDVAVTVGSRTPAIISLSSTDQSKQFETVYLP